MKPRKVRGAFLARGVLEKTKMVKWELDRQAAAICSEFGDWKQQAVTQTEIDETA